MKKLLLFMLTIFFKGAIVFGQSQILFNQQGAELGYSATKYNSQTIDKVNYDQYEVEIYFKNTSTNFIYTPSLCNVRFKNALEQPKFGSVPEYKSAIFNHSYGGVITCYMEYQDRTPISLNLNEPVKNLRYTQSHVTKGGFENKFIKYVFTKQGEPLPQPSYDIDFLDRLIEVNASNEVVNTWVERHHNRIWPRNGDSFPLPCYYLQPNNNGQPLGNRGDKADEINSENFGGNENTDEVYTTTEVLPSFNGNFGKFLELNLKYPPLAEKNNIQGRVIVSFVVEKDGYLTDLEITKGIGGGCDEEAIRVIKNSPKWNPGTQNGKTVRVNYSVSIAFQIADEGTGNNEPPVGTINNERKNSNGLICK